MKRNHWVTTVAACVGVALVVALVRAGDLNPPAGTIQPTMQSLAQIDLAIEELAATSEFTFSSWDHLHVTAALLDCTTTDWQQLIVGNGVLNSIVFNTATDNGALVEIRDSSGLMIFTNVNPSLQLGSGQYLDMNVRFTGGLEMRSQGPCAEDNTNLTLLYRLEPPSP